MVPSVSNALFDEVRRVVGAMGYEAGCGGCFEHGAQRPALDALLDLLDDVERQSGDPDIALRIGRLLGPVAVGIPGYLAMAGPTLLEALPRVLNYQRLVADGVTLRFQADGEVIRFHLGYSCIDPHPGLSNLLVSATRFFGAWLLGHEPPLTAVWFRHAPRGSAEFHAELFGVEPRFDAPDDGFALDRAWFVAPLRTAEASLVPMLEAQAARLLGSFSEDSFLAGIRHKIVEAASQGAGVEMADIAVGLHVSPRTLQRRLQALGTTYNRVLQELRMDMANRFLADERLSLHEVATLLGFREQSSFCHAYRQWTGRAPSEARRQR